jgi:hypothetical protein
MSHKFPDFVKNQHLLNKVQWTDILIVIFKLYVPCKNNTYRVCIYNQFVDGVD